MKQSILTVFLCVGVALVTTKLSTPTNGSLVEETAYDRVIKSNTITCGYVVYPPYVLKDANTGELSGIMVDLWDHWGKQLELNIKWTEEVNWGTMIEGLNTKRYDAVCSLAWENGTRARVVDFTTPFGYELVSAWTRPNSNIDLQQINRPTTKIATMDGEIGQAIARQRFPNAQTVTLPQSSSYAEVFALVDTGKADVLFSEAYIAKQFNKNNNTKLRQIENGILHKFPMTSLLPKGDVKLKTMLDSVIRSSIQNGTVEKVLTKHNIPDGVVTLPQF